MELPWLKNRNKYSGGGGPTVDRTADATHPDKLIDMVVDELMDAYARKDRAGLKQSLIAFMHMIQEEDAQ